MSEYESDSEVIDGGPILITQHTDMGPELDMRRAWWWLVVPDAWSWHQGYQLTPLVVPPPRVRPWGLNCDRPPDTKGGVGGGRGCFCVRPKAAAVGHELAAWSYAAVEVPACVSGYE